MPRTFGARHLELRLERKAAARHIGLRVLRRRVRLKKTQAEVAGDVFTSAYISAIERGLAAPSLASLLHLSRALEVRPAYFLYGLEVPNRGQDKEGPDREEARPDDG